MIKEVDEDDDGAICFREFLLIFKKAAAGELDLESGLGKLATLTEVGGTKSPSSALKLIKTEILIAAPGLASPGSRDSPGSPDCLVSRPTG